VALYWTSGGEGNPATGGSDWSLIGDLEQKVRTLTDERLAAPDPPSREADPPTMDEAADDASDDRSLAGWGRKL